MYLRETLNRLKLDSVCELPSPCDEQPTGKGCTVVGRVAVTVAVEVFVGLRY